ncbi:unnamed protein product, partial [Brugia timori]|uniref:Uncharacterized protein n=1 Tax=Brugia timori TaxID=42155 RepID=A0A0R3Q6I7_9BILA
MLNGKRQIQNVKLTSFRKHHGIKVGYDVLLKMDIGTNELTRPFRIPRRRTGENSAADGIPDKLASTSFNLHCLLGLWFGSQNVKESNPRTKRLRLGGQSDSRSPLASTSSIRKNDSAFSSRIVPLTKKKTTQDHQQTSTHSRKSKPGELFDRILDSMVNPPKERKKDTPQDDIDEAGPSGMTANIISSPP